LKKKVLVVDDSKNIRQLVGFTLIKDGFDVVEAEDGRAGLKALRENSDVALVISDVNMPVMNGIEMLKEIQASGKWLNLPILMLTTEMSMTLIEEAKKAGAKGWLVKPFAPEKLVAAVRKFTL
jgi:two-component system chemotaxis response regulator CheY